MANVDQRSERPARSDFASARDAARMLDVKPSTLYAYVSRGLLRSVAAPSGRARLYSVPDLVHLRTRRDARRGHEAVAAAALDWGAPVLDSAITRIDAAGPHYRGHSAVDLSRRGVPFEQVAELLWQGPAAWGWTSRSALRRSRSRDPGMARRAAGHRRSNARSAKGSGSASPSRLMELAAFVAARGFADPDRNVTNPARERDRAARLVYEMALALRTKRQRALPSRAAPCLASLVCHAYGLRGAEAERAAVDQMLVLCADHELNVSTFAVRVIASGGADLYACLAGGLCALSGAAHGGQCDRVEDLALSLQAATRSRGATQRAIEREMRARVASGEPVPGFGQPLYPEGDPRGFELLECARRLAARAPRVQLLLRLLAVMRGIGRGDPTLDFGLCAASAALGLPLGAASSIFALGRVSGWVAHVLEQRERPSLLRPRARYVGP